MKLWCQLYALYNSQWDIQVINDDGTHLIWVINLYFGIIEHSINVYEDALPIAL